MEQEEKKQKSQAAENQASCSPLQPVEPYPFISVIPLAVLMEIIEGHLMPDHIHMLVSIPPKYSISQFMGYLKGKSHIVLAPVSYTHLARSRSILHSTRSLQGISH